MWKDDPNGVFPDPQSIGMASPNMIAYQRYNALMMLMAGLKHGEFTQGAPIGGMAAVMIYQPGDAYGRSRYNPLAMRAMVIDKLRERLLGLMFVPDEPLRPDAVTLDDILAGRAKGRLYDAYRQSWVASPEAGVRRRRERAAAARPSQELQALLDAPARDRRCEGQGRADCRQRAGRLRARAACNRAACSTRKGKITPAILAQGEARHAGEAAFAGAVGRHLRRAERRRHHRAHPALRSTWPRITASRS